METLRKIDANTVEGEGFIVTIPDIHYVYYIEGNRKLTMEIEGAEDPEGHIYWYLYTKSMSGWLPPYETQILSRQERQKIHNRIVDSLRFLGTQLKLE